MPLGRLDEAERLLQEALRADPLSLDVHRELALVQIIAWKVRGGHRQPPARAGSRSRLPGRGFAPRESPDVRRQTAGGVSLWDEGKPSRMPHFWMGPCLCHGWPATEVKGSPPRMITRSPGDHLCRSGRQGPRARSVGPAADILPHRVGLLMMYRKWRLYAVTLASRAFAGSSACRRDHQSSFTPTARGAAARC